MLFAAGMAPTEALRLRGQGHSGQFGGPAGDIFVSFLVSIQCQTGGTRVVEGCSLVPNDSSAELNRFDAGTESILSNAFNVQFQV